MTGLPQDKSCKLLHQGLERCVRARLYAATNNSSERFVGMCLGVFTFREHVSTISKIPTARTSQIDEGSPGVAVVGWVACGKKSFVPPLTKNIKARSPQPRGHPPQARTKRNGKYSPDTLINRRTTLLNSSNMS